MLIIFVILEQNKTNHPISSNSHPAATANKAIHSLKKEGGFTKQGEHHIILTKYEAVHPTAVSENNSSIPQVSIWVTTLIIRTAELQR